MPHTDLSISDHHLDPPARGLLLSRPGGCIAGDGFPPRTGGRGGRGGCGSSVHDHQASGGLLAEGQQRAGSRVELHQHGPELCLPRLSGIVAIDRGLYHRVGMRAGPRVPVHGGPRTPALPSFLPSPISISKKGRKHVTTSGCRPTGRFSTWQEPRCGTVSGGFDKLFVNGNWIHMQRALPPYAPI